MMHMDFDEAQQRFARLTTQRSQGQIPEDRYRTQVNELRVQDPSGTWWQPDPDSGGWIFWDGSAWVPGTPPKRAAPAQKPRPEAPRSQPVPEGGGTFMDMKTFREISRTQPLSQRPQKWFDLLSILGGIVVAVLWFIYGSIRASTEGFDFVTPILLIGIPVMLALYRSRIDDVLVSIQPVRQKFSRPLLIGFAIATPFLTAFLLFNVLGFSNYALLHWNIILGTLLSYAIVREPVLASGGFTRPGMNGRLPMLMILVCCLCVTAVMADDCEKDPLNAQDCLRTAGYAQMLAAVVSATSGIFVNFPTFVQAVQPQGGPMDQWRQKNEDDFQKFVDKKREGLHYDKEKDAWVADSELNKLQQQRTQKQHELDELQKLHDKRVKNQKKNLINASVGAAAGGDADKAAQILKQEQQALADENARIRQMQAEIQKLDSEISYQQTRQQFHQQK
ncbi:MAG: hypothetical protein APR53_00990 [Methanoculleus sp. SDB]|nr:MAG: hypothetical protein APR53_00990 [Methanoculleus sp. SDB]